MSNLNTSSQDLNSENFDDLLNQIEGDSQEQIDASTQEMAAEVALNEYPSPSDPSGVGLALLNREFLDEDGVPTVVFYRTNWFSRESGVWKRMDLEGQTSSEWISNKIRYILSKAHCVNGQGNVVAWSTTESNLRNVAGDLSSRLRISGEVPTFLRMKDGYLFSYPVTGKPVVFRNGCVDAVTGEFTEGSPWLFSPSIVDANYDPEATAPLFEGLLEQMFCGRKDNVKVALQLMGLHLAGISGQDALFSLIGTPGSGKSTFTDVLTGIKTEGGVGVSSPQLLNQRFGLSGLDSCSLIIMPDIAKNTRWGQGQGSSRIKGITGGDAQLVEKKGKDGYMAQLNAQVLMVSNYLIVTGDEALDTRMRYMLADGPNMRNSEDKIEDLDKKILAQESAGVANLALAALQEMRNAQGGYDVGYTESHADIDRENSIQSNKALLLIDALEGYEITGNEEDVVQLDNLLSAMHVEVDNYEEELGKWKPSVRKVEDELRSAPLGVLVKRPRVDGKTGQRVVVGVRKGEALSAAQPEVINEVENKRWENTVLDALVAAGVAADRKAARAFLENQMAKEN